MVVICAGSDVIPQSTRESDVVPEQSVYDILKPVFFRQSKVGGESWGVRGRSVEYGREVDGSNNAVGGVSDKVAPCG